MVECIAIDSSMIVNVEGGRGREHRATRHVNHAPLFNFVRSNYSKSDASPSRRTRTLSLSSSPPTMKTAFLATLVGSAAAFAPSISRSSSCPSRPLLAAVTEGAAKSAAEDLELTLKVIMDNLQEDGSGIDDSEDDSAAAPPAATAAVSFSSGIKLWSVDYDAAARLAYEAAGSVGDFGAFKTKYLEETSAMVAKKGLL